MMRTNADIIIGIDPDVKKSGVGVVSRERKGVEVFSRSFPELRELKSDYEKDLDAEPRVYERDIQLCAKISLIEKLILEYEDVDRKR